MRSLRSIAIAIALGVAAPGAHAQTRATIVPSLSMGAVYDDNVSARARGDAGEMLQLRPSLEADYESPTVTLISLWSFDMQRSNHSALNALDARRHAMFDAKVRSSPLTTFGFAGRYDRTDTPGDIDFESGLLTDRRNAQRWQLTPSFLHRLGEKTNVTALYDFTTENLVNEGHNTLHVARTGMSQQLSARSSISGEYIGRMFDDDLAEHYSHAMVMGWTRQLRQFTSFTVIAGPRWTSYRGLAPEVSLSLARDGRTLKAGLDYSHGETIILGVSGPVRVDTGSARVTVVPTRRLEFGVRAGASSILTLDDRAATIYRGTLLGSWSVAGPFTITGSYSADYQLGDIRRSLFRDDRVLRHVIRVGLTISPRFSRSFLPPDAAARAKGVTR